MVARRGTSKVRREMRLPAGLKNWFCSQGMEVIWPRFRYWAMVTSESREEERIRALRVGLMTFLS